MRHILIAAVLATAAMASGASADTVSDHMVMATPAVDQWTVFGNGESHRLVRDSSVPGGYAFNVKVPQTGENPWDTQAVALSNKAVKTGDVMLLAFWARAVTPPAGTSSASVVAVMQLGRAPYTRIADTTLTVTGGWKLYYASGTAAQDFNGGELAAAIQLATGTQEIALGPVYMLDFGPGYDVAKLPMN